MDKRDYAIDFIRLVAILAVIVIHTTTYFLDRTAPFTPNFYVLHVINQVSRFAVPAFFAISGYLLGARYSSFTSVTAFYKKRISKILLPYFIWTVIYFLFIFPNPKTSLLSIFFIRDILTGDASYQLYFIPAIILLYAIFPIIVKKKNIFLTGRFMIFLGLVETLSMSYVYFFEPKIDIISAIPNAFYNLLPFILGIFASQKILDFKAFVKEKIIYFKIVSAISLLLIIGESIFMFSKTGKPMYLRDQWRITVTIYGVSVAGLFYNSYRSSWNKISSYLSSFSFGIFFVHVAILHNIMKFFYGAKLYDLFSFAISLTLTIILSFAFSIVFSKVKLINKLLGLKA